MNEAELFLKVQRSLMRDDVQPFESVRRLGGDLPRVWHRYFAGDFMASCRIRKAHWKRTREIWAVGESLDDALANLATAVANALYPARTEQESA